MSVKIIGEVHVDFTDAQYRAAVQGCINRGDKPTVTNVRRILRDWAQTGMTLCGRRAWEVANLKREAGQQQGPMN